MNGGISLGPKKKYIFVGIIICLLVLASVTLLKSKVPKQSQADNPPIVSAQLVSNSTPQLDLREYFPKQNTELSYYTYFETPYIYGIAPNKTYKKFILLEGGSCLKYDVKITLKSIDPDKIPNKISTSNSSETYEVSANQIINGKSEIILSNSEKWTNKWGDKDILYEITNYDCEVETPAGCFSHCLEVTSNKGDIYPHRTYYAPNVGEIKKEFETAPNHWLITSVISMNELNVTIKNQEKENEYKRFQSQNSDFLKRYSDFESIYTSKAGINSRDNTNPDITALADLDRQAQALLDTVESIKYPEEFTTAQSISMESIKSLKSSTSFSLACVKNHLSKYTNEYFGAQYNWRLHKGYLNCYIMLTKLDSDDFERKYGINN